MRPTPTRMIKQSAACTTPQQRPRHDLAWIWTDFLSEQRQATGVFETAVWRAAKDNLHDARARLKISSQYFHGKEASAQLHMRACTSAYTFFAESVKCISTGVVRTMHVQVCTLDRYRKHQRTHLLTRSLQDVHMRSCMCSLVVWRCGNEDGGV